MRAGAMALLRVCGVRWPREVRPRQSITYKVLKRCVLPVPALAAITTLR